jgi:hypothetical protein
MREAAAKGRLCLSASNFVCLSLLCYVLGVKSFDSESNNVMDQMIGNVILSQDAGRSLDKTNLYSVKTLVCLTAKLEEKK